MGKIGAFKDSFKEIKREMKKYTEMKGQKFYKDAKTAPL